MAQRFHIEYVQQTGSTNNDLKQRARDGAPAGLVLVAGRQTGGRGRLGRTFHSPQGCGLYASVLLRPDIPLADVNRITCYAAVVLHQAISGMTDGAVGIKWVNDIYRNGKKVCGILTESAAAPDGTVVYAVIGFGVNLIAPQGGFPADIAQTAGSVFDGGGAFEARRAALLQRVLDGLSHYEEALRSGHFMRQYRDASVLRHTPVVVHDGVSERDATALDIDERGRLHVRYDDGADAYLAAGDVSIRMR